MQRSLCAILILVFAWRGEAEICRFRADDGADPFKRWLGSSAITCVSQASELTFPPGLWNVFARTSDGISIEPNLVDGASSPETLNLDLVPAATLALQLPPAHRAVAYSPRHASAFPIDSRSLIPAGEDLWLIVLSETKLVAVIPITAVTAGSERTIDARTLDTSPAIIGWIRIADQDRAAMQTERGAAMPSIRVTAAGKEHEIAPLPPLDALNGAFFFAPTPAGNAELQLDGRGWLANHRAIHVEPRAVTSLREPLLARLSALLIVNWSTIGDLAAFDRSVGSCEEGEPPRLRLIVSACTPPQRPGQPAESCTPMRTESLRADLTFGTLTIGDVSPGWYRAELRFGKLPPSSVTTRLLPLQQQPIRVQALYSDTHGTLTRGGKPLGEGARIDFPRDGIGFAPRQSDEYEAILLNDEGFLEADSKFDITTCSGHRAFVLTDRPQSRRSRIDLDIPDNRLNITVIDTFTRAPLPEAAVHLAVMSRRGRVVVQRDLKRDEVAGFTIEELPEREIRLSVKNPGYKKKDAEPFTMPRSGSKDVEIELMPLTGSEGRIVSSHPFENAMIFWFSPGGVETEESDVTADGSFFFEKRHGKDETMTIVSTSHPLWIIRPPEVIRATPLVIAFPDGLAKREAEVLIDCKTLRTMTPVGVIIGGMRVPQPALMRHLSLRNSEPMVYGGGPLKIPALLESGPIEILRGPTQQLDERLAPFVAIRDFTIVASQPLEHGTAIVAFGGNGK